MKYAICYFFLCSLTRLWAAPDLEQHIQEALQHKDRSSQDKEIDARRKPGEVMAFFGVKPGMVIIDLFAAGGYYTELLARATGPEGRVIMHHNKPWLPYSQKAIDARLQENRLPNVVRSAQNTEELTFPEGQADMVLMALTLHDLFRVGEEEGAQPLDITAFLGTIYKALAPGGTLAIIDHQAEAGSGDKAAQDLHRIEGAFVKQVLTKAGFRFVAESNILENATDDHAQLVYKPEIRGKTDRFIYKFVKPN